MSASPGLRAAGDRIEELLDQLHATADPVVVACADELLRRVTELYGAALATVVDTLAERVPDLLGELVADDLVGSLLVVHDLHPDSLRSRVEAALASVRPLLAAHSGDVQLVDLDERAGAVRLRLAGSCDGCPSSALTLRNAVETAIVAAAPEVGTIDVDDSGTVAVTLGTKPPAFPTPGRPAHPSGRPEPVPATEARVAPGPCPAGAAG